MVSSYVVKENGVVIDAGTLGPATSFSRVVPGCEHAKSYQIEVVVGGVTKSRFWKEPYCLSSGPLPGGR